MPLRLWIALIATAGYAAFQNSVLTCQYDSSRAGMNAPELALSKSNVNSSQFGKLFSYPVDGYLFGPALMSSFGSYLRQGVSQRGLCRHGARFGVRLRGRRQCRPEQRAAVAAEFSQRGSGCYQRARGGHGVRPDHARSDYQHAGYRCWQRHLYVVAMTKNLRMAATPTSTACTRWTLPAAPSGRAAR